MESASLARILMNLLSSDNHLRQTSEIQYKDLVDNDPAETSIELIHVLNTQTDTSQLALAGILLKRNFECFWKVFSPSCQKTIQRLVLDGFHTTSLKSSKVFSEVLSKLATILKQNSGAWPEFVQALMTAFNGKSFQVLTGFKVLTECFAFYSEDLVGYKEKIYQVFSQNFFSCDREVKVSCCLCFLQVISVLSTAQTKYFIGLLHSLLKSILSLSDSDLMRVGLEGLRDLAETEPPFFKNRIGWCLEFVEAVVKSQDDLGCKYLALEFAVVLTESFPSLLNPQMLYGLISLFRIALEAQQNFPNDDIEINYERQICDLVSRVLTRLRGNFASSVIDYLTKSNDNSLNFRYVSIILMSQVSSEIFPTQLFDQLMIHLNQNLAQGPDSIHLAVIKTFRYFIKQYQGKFLIKNIENLQVSIKTGFASSSLQVVQETIKLLTDFLTCSQGQMLDSEFCEYFLMKLKNLIKSESIFIQVSKCIEALSDYFNRSSPLVFDMFYPDLCFLFNFSTNIETKAQALNSIIALRKTVSHKRLKTHLPEIFSMLKKLAENDFGSEVFKTSVLENWKALARYFGPDFTLCLGEILPGLLMYISTEQDDIEEHLETLLVIIEATQESFIAYLNTTSKLILEIMVNDVPDAVRALTCSIGASLVEIVLKTSSSESKEGVIKFAKQFFVTICQVCAYEQDTSTLIDMLQSLQKIISAPNQSFLSKIEIEVLGEILIQFLHSQKSSHELKQSASQVLSSMFKTHTAHSVQILDYFYSSLINKYLFDSSPDSEKLFALSIFSDIVSIVGNVILIEKLENIVNLILNFLNSNDCKIKVQAIQGVIEGTKVLHCDRFKLFAGKIFVGLEKIILACTSRKDRKVFEWAVAAVCFILHFQEDSLKAELILTWVSRFLPLGKIVTAVTANEIFVDFVLERFKMLVADNEVFNSLMRISGSAYIGKDKLLKIKDCTLLVVKEFGIEEIYRVVEIENHQYLNKLLQ